MNEYQKIEALFEDFERHEGVFPDDVRRFCYAAPDSMHSGITKLGYGKRLELSCVDITSEPLCVSVRLRGESIPSRRYYVRLTACMPDWRKYCNNLKIQINGTEIYNYDNTLFENVCVGWPVTYYPFSAGLLRDGENILTVSTTNCSGGGLYVAAADLLSLPAIEDGTQISSLRYARVNEPFTVAFYGKEDCAVCKSDGLRVLEVKRSTLDSAITLLRCVAESGDVCLQVLYGGKIITLLCPAIVGESEDRFLVGADNDDYRQDYSEEGDRIPMIFALTGMGNFFQFRPSMYRSVAEFPDEATWIKRTKWLYDFNIRLSIADPNNRLSFLEDVDPSMYEGKHCHETYLYFSKLLRESEWGRKRFFIDLGKIERAETFGECKSLYLEALDKMRDAEKTEKGSFSVGAPSLLAVYEASKFPRVTMEPVSGVNLLLSATRGASGGKWGAHIPVSWYYGYFNDAVKAKKYWNTMFYCYLNGADYVYAENSLFKAQSMSREDWDTEFCIVNRRYTREMYDYSIVHPRNGRLQIPFACVYGNNEYILWQKDSRIPELEDGGDWDLYVWGKWKESNTYLCWRAIDAWLPVAENQNTVDDKYNLSLHSGTKFGAVDVIPYEKDFSAYKLVVFLGWNTYEDALAGKLYNYIEQGGCALISYCHFNKTDRFDQPFDYACGPAAEKLLGFSAGEIVACREDVVLDGEIYANRGGVKIVVPQSYEGEPLCCDKAGNVLFYRRKIGRGYLYFCTFATYYGTRWAVDVMKKMLEKISYGLCSSYCDNGNIAYTERVLPDGKRVFHCMNMSSGSKERQKFTIYRKEGEKILPVSADIGVCEIKEIVV